MMSVLAIPFREILDPYTSTKGFKKAKTVAAQTFHGKRYSLRNVSLHEIRREHFTKNRNENKAIKFLSSASCDPLLDLINVADFEDDKKLQRNFEEVLQLRKMGFSVKIVKQSWFPGLICIPIFHCQRCLALWTQAAQVTTFCSEVNRSVYGRLIPISITKCELLAKLLDHDRKPTAKRLCKQLPLSKPDCQPVKPAINLKEKSPEESIGGRVFKPIPVAEFVDINEELRKYRRTFLRELKGMGSNASGRLLDTGGRHCSRVDEIRSDDDVKAVGKKEETALKCDEEVCNEETSTVDEELKSESKSENVKPIAHTRSCYSNRNKVYKEGARARPSTPQSFGNGLKISSKNYSTKLTTLAAGRKPGNIPQAQHVSKINRPASRPYQPLTTPDILLKVAYENKLAELRAKTLGLDNEILKQVLGDRFETLDQNVINSFWFKSLVEEISKQTESLKTFKWELTRAFCFSYFELLRKKYTK